MQKLILVLIIVFSLASTCSAQQYPATQAGSTRDVLPDAPHSQIASLFSALSREDSDPTINQPSLAFPALRSLEGTRLTLSLMSAVSSKLPVGSTFQARLDQPLTLEGRVVLPEGTLFQGHIQTRPARRLMRAGSLFMTFDRMVLPDGGTQKVDLHLIDADTSAIKADPEGRLHPAVSKKRLAIQLGGTALTAKFADDLAELAGGTAVGAGTARFIGAGAAATFFVLQKGREVKLNAGDKLDVEFGRSIPPVTNGDMLSPHR